MDKNLEKFRKATGINMSERDFYTIMSLKDIWDNEEDDKWSEELWESVKAR